MTGKIVCMVRGGEAGRNVQERAIHHARQSNKTLVFVHIVDIQSIPIDHQSLVQAAREELTWLGRVTLSMARRRAERAGIQVEVAILYGTLFEAIRHYLVENPVECLFLGSPHPGTPNYMQRLERVSDFASRLSQASGIEVQMIPI